MAGDGVTSPVPRPWARAFWRSAAAEGDLAHGTQLCEPKFPITRQTRIFTAGSCFALHLARASRDADRTVIDTEPMDIGLPGARLYRARRDKDGMLRVDADNPDEAETIHGSTARESWASAP